MPKTMIVAFYFLIFKILFQGTKVFYKICTNRDQLSFLFIQ